MQSISNLSKYYVKSWVLHLFSGFLLIMAGIIILANPLAGYIFISIFFSLTLLTSGLVETTFALINREGLQGWGGHLAAGIINLLIGVILVVYPLLTMALIPFILGFWLMFRGIILLILALSLRSLNDTHWKAFFLGGILLSIFAIFIIINPALGAITTIGLVCGGFLIAGILNIALSFRLRHL